MKVEKYRILPYYSWPPTGTYPEKSGNFGIFFLKIDNEKIFLTLNPNPNPKPINPGLFYRAKSYFSRPHFAFKKQTVLVTTSKALHDHIRVEGFYLFLDKTTLEQLG